MASKTRNPAVRQGFGFGKCFPATSTSEDTTPLSEIQSKHLVARFGLAADRARLVAYHAFGEAARG